MPNTRCMFEVIEKCTSSSCKFIHKKDEEEWNLAPILDRRTARAMIDKSRATKQLRSFSRERNAERGRSQTRQPSSDVSVSEKPAAQERVENKEGKTSSSSSSSKCLTAKDSADFKTDCFVVIGLISNLRREGNSAIAMEKVKKIYAVLGKKMPE